MSDAFCARWCSTCDDVVALSRLSLWVVHAAKITSICSRLKKSTRGLLPGKLRKGSVQALGAVTSVSVACFA